MNAVKQFVLVAVLALGGMGGVAVIDSPAVGTQRAEAGWQLVPVYIGTVTERDSSTVVYFVGRAIGRGQRSGLIAVNGVRQSWTNSQRAREWVTLRGGTAAVVVDRTRVDQGRQLLFHCYQYRWVYR